MVNSFEVLSNITLMINILQETIKILHKNMLKQQIWSKPKWSF